MELEIDSNSYEMINVFRGKALRDPGYAVAYALLELARHQRTLCDRIDDLGFGRHDRNSIHGAPGTTEMIGMQLKDLVGAVEGVGHSLGVLADHAQDFVAAK